MRPRRYVYRHIWPIRDLDRPLSALRVEAAAVLDALAASAGARIVGEPVWVVAGDRLVVEAPARPAAPGEARWQIDQAIVRLVCLGWTEAEVADVLGLPVDEVATGGGARGGVAA